MLDARGEACLPSLGRSGEGERLHLAENRLEHHSQFETGEVSASGERSIPEQSLQGAMVVNLPPDPRASFCNRDRA